MDEERIDVKDEEITNEQKSLLSWIKKHRMELVIAGISVTTIIFVVLGIKNKDSIRTFWNNLKEEISKPSTYSSKWFDTVTDDVLSTEREKVRLAYCGSGNNYNEACRLERLLGLFDKEMGKRAWADKTPCPPSIHREHGWYLPNDD